MNEYKLELQFNISGCNLKTHINLISLNFSNIFDVQAEQNLSDALERSKHDLTFSALARLYLETNRIDKAVDILKSGMWFLL